MKFSGLEFPSSAEEGWPKAGVVLFKKANCFTNTTPSARLWKLRIFILIAQPPLLG
jgi:hypothetical protein